MDDAATARQAEADGADYLGVGPIFGTRTKGDAGPAVGLEQYLPPPTPQQWVLDDPALLNRLYFARHLADQLRYEEGLALA